MCKLFNASSRISGGGRDCEEFSSKWSVSGAHRMSSPVGSRGGSKSFDAIDPLARFLGFSVSCVSASSDGGSGSAAGGASADDASPSAMGGDLVDDARRFHVRVVRTAWSFLGRRGGRSNRIQGWREVAEEAFSSDRDRRITWERINFWTVNVKSESKWQVPDLTLISKRDSQAYSNCLMKYGLLLLYDNR
jgi:hypothetical protein